MIAICSSPLHSGEGSRHHQKGAKGYKEGKDNYVVISFPYSVATLTLCGLYTIAALLWVHCKRQGRGV